MPIVARAEQPVVRRILVADDQKIFRESLCETLRLGLKDVVVYPARDGVEAAAVIEAEKIDLVVADLQMPELDGVALLTQLKAAEFAGQILVLSGFLDLELKRVVRELGALTCLEKPVELSEVVALCKATLEAAEHGIRGLSASGVAQLLALERKTGMLRVSCAEGQGDLFFDQGELVNALTGALTGEEAAMKILLWDDNVELEILDIVPNLTVKIQQSLHTLLLESARMKDEKNRERSEAEPMESLEAEPGNTHLTEGLMEQEGAASNVRESLAKLIQLEGALEVALIDLSNGKLLGSDGGGLNRMPDISGVGNAEVVRAENSVLEQLNLNDQIEDILITLGNQYHLVRMLRSRPDLFLYLSLDRSETSLATARRELVEVESHISI